MDDAHLHDVINELMMRRPHEAKWSHLLQINPPGQLWTACSGSIMVTGDVATDARALIQEMMSWHDRGLGVTHIRIRPATWSENGGPCFHLGWVTFQPP